MALINLNSLLDAIRGRIGKTVFRRRPDGTIILSGIPRYKKRKATPAQKAHRERVKEIGPYASQLSKIHPIYARLAAGPEAKGKWLSAYNFAFADCMKPPVIQRIERREGLIRVEATDNVWVERLYVIVKDRNGRVLETGNATRAEGDWWEFPTRTEGTTIAVQAWDIPGNRAELVQ